MVLCGLEFLLLALAGVRGTMVCEFVPSARAQLLSLGEAKSIQQGDSPRVRFRPNCSSTINGSSNPAENASTSQNSGCQIRSRGQTSSGSARRSPSCKPPDSSPLPFAAFRPMSSVTPCSRRTSTISAPPMRERCFRLTALSSSFAKRSTHSGSTTNWALPSRRRTTRVFTSLPPSSPNQPLLPSQTSSPLIVAVSLQRPDTRCGNRPLPRSSNRSKMLHLR